MADETERLVRRESRKSWKSTRDEFSDYDSDYDQSRSSEMSPFVTDDRRPPRDPKERITSSIWYPASFVLAFSFFITIVQHGVRFNIVTYSEQVLDYNDGKAPVLVTVFDAVAPCLPLIGGWLGDAWFPRYKVIITGCVITFFGSLLLTINVGPYSEEAEENFSITAKRALFLIGFTAIFVGLALYDANDYVMVARQFENGDDDDDDEDEKIPLRNIFCVFYIVYFSAVFLSHLMFQLIESTSFFLIYFLATCSVLIAFASAVLGRRLYVSEQRHTQKLWNQFRIIWEGIRRRKDAPEVKKCTARASVKHGGSFPPSDVYETAHLLRTLPIFHTVTIFIIVNYFINMTYIKQTHRMKPVGHDDVTIPEFTYKLYQPIMSVLTNIVVLALLHQRFNFCRFCHSSFIRIGIGIAIGIMSVVSAGIVESRRKTVMEDEFWVYTADNVTVNASYMSVTAQIPQYTFAGIGDVLVLTAGVEIAYAEAAPNLKGFTVGLFLLMSGVGSYILAQLIVVIVNGISGAVGQEWYTEEINDGRLDYFYFLLAAILLFDLLYVYLVTRNYERANWDWSADDEERGRGSGRSDDGDDEDFYLISD